MRFAKLSEEQINSADESKYSDPGNLYDGWSKFVIDKSILHRSKNGSESIKLSLLFCQPPKDDDDDSILRREGSGVLYLGDPHNGCMWLWSSILKSIGFSGGTEFFKQNNGFVQPEIFSGKEGACMIERAIETYNDKQLEKIKIIKYIPADKILYDVNNTSVSRTCHEIFEDSLKDDDVPF